MLNRYRRQDQHPQPEPVHSPDAATAGAWIALVERRAPAVSAEEWCAYYRRQAQAAIPAGLVPTAPGLAATRAAQRTNALRAGDYRETPLNVG